MKFGETLRARSIPEWSHFNVAYDEIKTLIKRHTTADATPGQSVAIPGHEDVRQDEFAATFYRLLVREHERTCLFVKSKKGEVERRLADLRKRYLVIQDRYESAPRDRIPPRRLMRFAQLESEILTTGQTLKSLSRFMVTQYTAFQKLLKKYRRWTRDAELPARFHEKILDRPMGLQKENLDPILDEWTLLLAEVRSLVTPPTSDGQLHTLGALESAASHGKSLHLNNLSKLLASGQQQTSADFDAGFEILSFDQRTKQASYWVHADHIIELYILLLQHLKLSSVTDTTRAGTPGASGNMSRNGSIDSQSALDGEAVGAVVLEDLKTYGEKQSSGLEPVVPTALARWTSANEARVIVPRDDAVGYDIAPVKRKRLAEFFDLDSQYKRAAAGDRNGGASDATGTKKKERSGKVVRSWLAEHRNVKPQVTITSRRTRFVGLTNTSDQGVWVTLDRGLEIFPGLETAPVEERNEPIRFPFALLTVLSTGPEALCNTLDASHLLQRVFNFNLTTHAVWECYKPADLMSPPSWLDLASKDIRKVPQLEEPARRRNANIRISPATSGPPSQTMTASTCTEPVSGPGETSATSVSLSPGVGPDPRPAAVADMELPPGPETPHLEPFLKKPVRTRSERIARAKRARALREAANRLEGRDDALRPANATRYWSEYDHPEDGSNENAYVIYIDPNDSGMPFGDFFTSVADRFSQLYRKYTTPNEDSSPLLDPDYFSPDPRTVPRRMSTSSSSSTEDDDSAPLLFSAAAGRTRAPAYSTFTNARASLQYGSPRSSLQLPNGRQSAQFSNRPSLQLAGPPSPLDGMLHKRIAWACLVAAALLAVVVLILISVGRTRMRGKVELGGLLGALSSFAFAGVGIASAVKSMWRSEEYAFEDLEDGGVVAVARSRSFVDLLEAGAMTTVCIVTIGIDIGVLAWVGTG